MSRILVLALLVLAGCSSPVTKIDGSSEASLKRTIAAVKKTLPPDRVPIYEKAVARVTARAIHEYALGGQQMVSEVLREKLDGKTASEVIAAGDAIKADLDAKKANP